MRVLVTRPQPQADEWVQRLRAAGVDAVALPLMQIQPVADDAPLRAAWTTLPRHQLVMFVSANAVQAFFAARPLDALWPPACWAGSTGPGTSAALRACGVAQGCIREPAPDSPRLDTEALWQQRLQDQNWRGQRVLVVRGEGGRDWLADTLREHGAQVDFLTAYRRAAPTLDAPHWQWLAQAQAHPFGWCWLFSSSEAVANLTQLVPQANWSQARALATHPRIADNARKHGFVQAQVVAPGFDAQVQALKHLDTGAPPG
ncbi:uroporphyrinogen-III synthase [Burkholderiales bacterium JOSHI_001]|nr:uroporphyrinogen-III synthase [Burkholderiales bacterium JOSHI_001]